MSGCSAPAGTKDRCVFTSMLLLGALMAMQATPCSRPSFMPLFILLGFIPLMTFQVAAPSRLGLGREISLHLRGLEALALNLMLLATGRIQAAAAVRAHHRKRVEVAYGTGEEAFAEVIRTDPLRLHHARRVALAVTTTLVLAGLALPVLQPAVYTYGSGAEAPFVMLLDLVTLAGVGRIVSERVGMRLLEITHGPRLRHAWIARVFMAPVSAMLGVALGAVASLVVVGAAAIACAIETAWLADGTSMSYAAAWFMSQTAIEGMAFGMGVGGVFGAGMGLACRQEISAE